MGWGDSFKRAYEAASDTAKAKAEQALASVSNAAAAVQDMVTQGVGEVVNTVAGVVTYAGAALVRKAKQLFDKAKALFSDAAPEPAQNLITRCPGQGGDVFSRDYRDSLIDSSFHGADQPELNAAMHALQDNPDPATVEQSLRTIAEQRERPLAEIEQEYQEYLRLKEQMEADILDKGLDKIDRLKDSQKDFMGSTWQLRYGQVVGDQLGVDPVFAALLNPTGGLVGPGNKGLNPDGALMPEAVAYHGAYHDATGHLYNYFGEGPGYNYVGSPIGLSTDNPLAGQTTGIAEWELLLLRNEF